MNKKEFEKMTKRGEGEKPSPSSAYQEYAKIRMQSALSDYGTGMQAMGDIYSGWQSPEELERRKSVATNASRKMMTARNTYGIDTYDDVIATYNKSLAGIDDIAKGYAYYQNGDAYNKAQKNYGFSQKYNGSSYADIQKALSSAEDEDEKEFLKGYTKFSSLEDFDQALASATGDYKKGLKREREAYEKAHRFDKYAELRNNADFGEVLPSAMDELRRYEMGVATDPIRALTRGNIAFADSLDNDKYEVAAYIFKTQGENAYKDFMKDMTFEARQNEAAEIRNELNTAAEENPVASTVINTLANPIFGFMGGVEQIGATLSGSTDPTISSLLTKGMSEANSVVAQNIKEEAGWLPSFAYEVFTTGVPNRVGQLLYGKAYTAVMGMSSFATTYADEIENGADTTSALMKAFASGAIETLTELIPWDLAFGKGKTWYTTMAKQMFFEGSEEAIGAIANLTYDAIANGGYSEFQQKVQRYVEQGYERSQAESMAWKDFAVDTAKQFAIAALSVAPTTGTASITQAVQESSAGKFVNREMLGEINNEDLKKKYGDEWTQKASNREVYKAYSDYVGNLQEESSKAEKKATAQAIAKEYKITEEEANTWAEALYNGDKKKLNTHFGQALTEDVNNREGWTKAIDTTETTKIASKINKAFSMIKTKDQVAAEKASKAIKTGEQNLVNGKEAEIISMKENKDGSYTVKTSEGEVNAKDVTVTEQKATALTYSANIENEAFKEAYVRYYAGEDIADYDTYARYLYQAGRQGIDYSDKTNILDTLGVAKAQAIYNVGALESLQEEIEDSRLVDEVTEKYAGKFRVGNFKAGTYSNGKFKENKDFFRNLNRTQKRLYKIVESFSKLSGINVRTFIDRDAASENGQFIAGRDGGTIYINLAARPFADNAYGINQYVVSTLSHELTHWLKANNREAYDILEEAVKKDLQKNNTLEKRLSTERETLLKTHENELKESGKSEEEIKAEMEKYSKKKDLDEIALEEVVARACEDMLNDADTMQEVLSFADQEDLNTLQAALKKWFERIRSFFNDLMHGFHAPNEVVADLQKTYDHLRELWVNGIKEAIAQNRREQKTTQRAVASKKVLRSGKTILETNILTDGQNYTIDLNQPFAELKPFSELMLKRWSNSKKIIPLTKAGQLGEFVLKAMSEDNFKANLYLGVVTDTFADKLMKEFNTNVKNYNLILTADDVRKEFNHHTNETWENSRNQRIINENDFYFIPYVIAKPDSIEDGGMYLNMRCFRAKRDGITVVVNITDTGLKVSMHSMYIDKNKGSLTAAPNEQAFGNTSKTTDGMTSFDKSVSQPNKQSNNKKSVKMDSEGRTLTTGQQTYFEKSKVRDDQGRLKVMYHGARGVGFTIFNANRSDDGRSLFFVDSLNIAKTYSGTHELFTPDKPYTYDELNNMMTSFTHGDNYLEKDGKDVLVMAVGGNEDYEVFRGTLKEAQTFFMDSLEDIHNEDSANYQVYLNVENPLVIDAKNNNWDEIEWESIESKEMASLLKILNDYDWGRNNVSDAEYDKALARYEELENQLNSYGDISTTRGISAYAQAHGYDGVIFENLFDYGLYASSSEKVPANVVIVFNADQVKSIYNENPTHDLDIRKSTKLDSEGNELSEGQQNYFEDSKARDDQGRLLVMYHGTDSYEDFTVFKAGKDGYLGKGIYFTEKESIAKRYAEQNGYKGRTYKVYLNVKNPLIVTSENPALEILGEKVAKKRAEKNSFSTKWLTSADIKKLQAKGYDGIIWKYGKSPVEISVWDSNQIKLTTNENPTSDKDIRRSVKMDSEGRALSEGQQSYFADSKVRDKNGNLLVVRHGTENEFNIFNPQEKGGQNGTAEGFGIYFSDDIEITNKYGDIQLEGYLNIVKPAYDNKKTITSSDLVKLIKATTKYEMEKWDETEERDTWISNYVDTYNVPLSRAYTEVANNILKLNGNDKDIIQEIMVGMGIRGYKDAYEFYDILTKTLGFDGFVVRWTHSDGESNVYVALNSEQFKRADNLNPTENPDIRKSVRMNSVETIGAADVDTKTGTAVYFVRYTLAERYKELGYKSYADAVGKVAADIAKQMGVSKLKAEDWIKAEESLSSIILKDAENERYLDYTADDRYSAIKTDTDYPQGTIDLSNLCRKREIFTKMFDSLQRENPDVLFTAEDIAKIRQILTEANYEVACALCYVEDRRQHIGEIAKSFSDSYKKALASKSKVIYRTNTDGELKPLVITEKQASKYGLNKGDFFKATDSYVPNQYDLTTYQGYKELVEKHPTIAAAFENFNNSRGQSAARLIEGHAEYKREILKWKKSDIDKANNHGGLRVFSFSDFEAIHLIDIVQVVMDCSSKGVMIQAYTKVPSFANLVKNTNIKLNRSLIPANKESKNAYAYVNGKAVKVDTWVDDGVALVDGQEVLAFDIVEGIDITDENFLDMSGNKNVGNILVGINEKQIRLAMEDDFIDYIIPFHTNQAKNILEAKNIHRWDNYKLSQLDKKVNGKGKDHGVNIYTDVINKYNIRNKKDFVRAFLNECKNQHYKPRFAEFLNKNSKGDYIYTEGYHKFLVDYKLFDTKGNILTQEVVRPDFDIELMNKILLADKTRSMNMKFSDEIMDKVKKELSIDSRKSVKMDSNGNTLTKGQQNYFKDSKVVDDQGRLLVVYHGTYEDFEVFKPNKFTTEKNGLSKIVGYFSEDKEYAEIYGDTKAYYLNIKNPLVMDGEAKTLKEWEKFFKANGVTDFEFDSSVTGKNGQADPLKGGRFEDGTYYTFYELLDSSEYWYGDGNLSERIQAAGYDGIQSNDEFEKAWMPFNAEAVKSVDNANPTDSESVLKSTKLSPEAQKLVDELTLENKRLTEENTALKMEKGIEKAKAEKQAIIDKITEQSQVLSRWLLTNDKNNPVPQAIKEPLGKLLTSISFTKDDYEWRKERGNLTKAEETLGERMAKISQLLLEIEQDKAVDKDAYDLSQLDWIPEFSTEFAKIKDAVASAEARQGESFKLSKMSTEDLESLSNMITALKSAITNMNKCLSAHNKMSVSGVGQSIVTYLDRIGQKKVDNRATQFLEIDNTVPFYFFKRLGPGGQQAFKLLMDGMNQYAFEAKQIEDYAKGVFSGKDVNAWRNEVKTFEVDEIEYGTQKGEDLVQPRKKTIQMTVPQIMSLYCLSKRDQAIKHLSTGGIKIGDFKVKGAKETTRQIENTTLTKASLETIINSLTAEQKEVADKLQEFMNTVCQKWGNEVTMKRFGFKGMTEKNYFPIKVDQNQLSREARQRGTSLYQLLNMGFTKPINPKAKNPIEIFDIFEVFAMHSTEMAQYHSLALPVLDVIRIWNYKDLEMLDEAENKAHWHSVKASIENTLGAKGNQYIGLLLADMNGDVSGGRADDLAGKIMKNYKTAAVAANLQVAALQPLSYIRAGYMIDPKYLTKGMAMKSTKDALKWCGIAVWKDMGFYNTSIHRGLEHKIMQDESKKESIIEKGLYLAGKADEWTWSKLWNACLLETQDKQPNLKGDELYKATADRLTEVIYGTQVVDSILTRSQIMRDKTMYSKMITAFQSEPTLALNVLMDAAESFSMEARANGKQAALQKYGDTLRRAALVYLIGSAVESLLRAVIGKIRNYDGDEDDENLIVDFFKRFIEELNPLRKIPIIKDAVSILIDGVKVLFGWQYKIYTDTRMDEAIFENLGKAAIRLGKLFQGKTVNYKVLYEIAKGIDASGVPVSSTFRAFKVFWNNTIGRIWPGIALK